jgi:hypothetical protein
MSIWEAIEKLSELVDDSDPDVGFFILFYPLVFPSVGYPFRACMRCLRLRGLRPVFFLFFAQHLRRISDVDI